MTFVKIERVVSNASRQREGGSSLSIRKGPLLHHRGGQHSHSSLTINMPEEFDTGPVRTWDGPVPPAQGPDPNDHLQYMRLALDQAQESPPKPTNFCVGALLVDGESGAILERGYTLECEGNTHAEQCCLIKFARKHDLPEERVGEVLPASTVIYTTMEPCNKRSVGNIPCVDRLIRTRGQDGQARIKKVYLGVKEPEKFVGANEGTAKLRDNGIECIHVPGLEERILQVATAGHET